MHPKLFETTALSLSLCHLVASAEFRSAALEAMLGRAARYAVAHRRMLQITQSCDYDVIEVWSP